MSRYNRRNVVSKTFKDYLVPFIGVLLIVILIISFIGWDKETNPTSDNLENKIWMNVSINSDTSEAYIEYIWWDKKDITWEDTKLYKWEKIIVQKWDVDLKLEWVWEMRLNNRWELKHNEDASFSLFSSKLWVKSDSKMKINFRYWSIDLKDWSVASITQNEAASTVYLLDWLAEVRNVGWKSTMLWKWQKIEISNKDSSNADIDLSLLKTAIDDYFKTTDWFVKNNWSFYLEKKATWTWVTREDEKEWSRITSYITLDELNDEAQVATSKINIKWKLYNEDIASIIVNWEDAVLNLENKTFEVKEFTLKNKTNDLVFKIYNSSKEILSKKVYTIYYSWWEEKATTWIFKVENFSLDSTKFQFIFPKTNPYTTFADLVSIEGKVPPWIVESISVNDYKLQKFPRNWSYWKYHANKDFWNLKEWLNIYKIVYYGKWWSVLHTNAYTIIKKEKVVVPEKKIISWEAGIQ